ncbi:aspartic proteinase NANA, chloroplast-like [Curcuma longa]|uniref:aspartic proteinase NANA, chloroplast-like n=1 Tax=Curcuma longa TaxID=136217 RepID=UPI003D9E62D0
MSPPLLLLLLLLLCFPFSLTAATGNHSDSFLFELHRRPALPGLDQARRLLLDDKIRQRTIRARLEHARHRRRACGIPHAAAPAPAPTSFEMPLNSGAYAGTGQYFVRFQLGTPAQRFELVADTGSDLTWAKCRRRGDDNKSVSGRAFLPAESSSFRPILCSSDMCRNSLPFSLTTCPTPASPCAYDYGYSDGSAAHGIFANESATVILSDGRRTKLRGLVVGCTSSAVGSSFRASDGVLGLGYSDISFAVRAGGRFAYCLVDHLSPRNATGFLAFGPAPAPPPPNAGRRWRETAISLDVEPFYSVRVRGISVDKEMLPIPASVWDLAAGGGAILDSGTSLTVLAEPAYRAVVEALTRRLAWAPRVRVEPFEHCYNWSTGAEAALPRMAVHLAGKARLAAPAKSYVIDVAEGVKCLGIVAAPWPSFSTIGNILQQEHLWDFDIANRRLRFRRSTCRKRP